MSRTGPSADGNEADGFEAFPNSPQMIFNVMYNGLNDFCVRGTSVV
jgi:hypothetical protein